jgi:hypothetical protein
MCAISLSSASEEQILDYCPVRIYGVVITLSSNCFSGLALGAGSGINDRFL